MLYSAIMLDSTVFVYFIGASWGEFSDFYDSLSSKSTIYTLFVPIGPNVDALGSNAHYEKKLTDIHNISSKMEACKYFLIIQLAVIFVLIIITSSS